MPSVSLKIQKKFGLQLEATNSWQKNEFGVSENQPNDIKKGAGNQGKKWRSWKGVEFGIPIGEDSKRDGKEESC